jgi:glycosyltransferase involved in cell wall biosynthesis
MILSIGMIVKNEEKYLLRCLTAIESILKNTDCELIIADTGSTDNTIEIARKFTDKVYTYEWQDDFAAARNFVIDKSKGEWIMSLDADEIFEDTTDIVSFFNTGDYKRYKSASYGLVNFNSVATAHDYAVIDIVRLVRRTSKTRYINRIHENILYEGPTKALSSKAIHYGYADDQTDKLRQKSENYRAMLLEELQRNPNNVKALFDISNTYAILSDYGPALEYCDRALENVRDDDRLKVSLYAAKASIYNNLKNGEKLSEVAEEYFNINKPEIATDLEMYFYQGSGAYRLEDFSKVIKSIPKYIELYEKYKNGKLNTPDALDHAVNFTNETSLRYAFLYLVNSYIAIGDHASAQNNIAAIDIRECLDDERYMTFRLQQELALMSLRQDFTRAALLYEQLDDKNLAVFQELLETGLSDNALRHSIMKGFADTAIKRNNYFELMAIRYAYDSGTLVPGAVEAFISEVKSWESLYADVIYIALSTGAVKALADRLDPSELYDYFFTSRYLHYSDLIGLAARAAGIYTDDQDAMILSWLSALTLWALLSNQLDKEQVYDMFCLYSKSAYNYLKAIVKEDLLTDENITSIPRQLRPGYYCYMAAEAISRGQETDAVKYLRCVIQSFPEFINVVETLLTRLQAQKPPKKSEFEMYAIQLKQNIRTLIDNNKLKEAGDILNSLGQLCPNDAEIPVLRARINSKAGVS